MYVSKYLRTRLTTYEYNTADNNCIVWHARNTTAFQPNIFLTGTHRLLVTSNGWSAFPSANNCQGQLQTAESLCVTTYSTGTVRGSRSLALIRPAIDGHLCQVYNPTKSKAMVFPYLHNFWLGDKALFIIMSRVKIFTKASNIPECMKTHNEIKAVSIQEMPSSV
jgi:hypothetical protein